MRHRVRASVARAALAIGLAAVSAASGPAGARMLEPSDVRRLVELQAPAISPDGGRVAFISIASDATGTRSISTLSLVDVATRRIVALIRGRDVAVPRWSPDGAQLGYLARPRDGAALALYVRDAAGASRRLAAEAGNIVDFAWRPDGAAVAFAAEEPPARARDYFYADDNDVTATAAPLPIHLWTVATAGGRAKRLTSGSWTLPPTDPGGIFTSQFAWTNRHTIVYTPTLIWGTTGDPIVPIASSYAMYHALRDDHVPAAFAVFHAGTHGPDSPRQVEELTILWTLWLDRFLKQ